MAKFITLEELGRRVNLDLVVFIRKDGRGRSIHFANGEVTLITGVADVGTLDRATAPGDDPLEELGIIGWGTAADG